MRLRTVKNKEKILSECPFLITDGEEHLGKWHQVFGNDNPINVEIGMGKGKFIYEMALNYPNINFIGIEKYDKVITRAVKKITELPNLKLICCDAINLNKIFAQEINTIYLNFSDPWPKKRHTERRLTSKKFLTIYDEVFKNTKTIILKTDSEILFSSSIVSLSEYGYTLKEISMDLHNTDLFNITTEYEEKFKSLGVKINYLKAIK